MWGAIAELIKAIGVLYGHPPTGHKEIVETGKRMALELEDQKMFKFIDREAQALHANFYEGFLSEEAFADHYLAILDLATKLRNVLNKKRQELYPAYGRK